MKFQKTCSERFRTLRLLLDLTQRDLVKKFGVSAAAVGHCESATKKASDPALKILEIYEQRNVKSRYSTDHLGSR